MDLGVLPPLSDLDHCCVFCKLKIRYLKDTSYVRNVWDYKNGDFDGLCESLLKAPWDVGLDMYDDIDDCVEYFLIAFLSQQQKSLSH